MGLSTPRGPRVGGTWVDFDLWVEGSAAMDPTLRLSIGLYDTSPAQRQWAPVLDEQPLGPLLSLRDVPGVQRWPVRLRLPQGVPPDSYEARLKWYRPADGAVLEGTGENMVSGDQMRVAVVEVGPTPANAAPPAVGTRQEARFDRLLLLGHAIPPGPWQQGASIPVELVWRAVEEPGEDLHIFLASDALSVDDGGVTSAVYPTSQWREGEVVRDIHYVTVAPDALPGAYPLFLRVSRAAMAIPWTRGLFHSGEVLQIGTLVVQDRPRTFAPPEIATPLAVAFGDSIELVGATLPEGTFAPGAEVPLTLHWFAAARPPERYKLFTHLVGADGNLCGQRDLEPADGMLPTSGWAKGEFVTTTYSIALRADLLPGPCQLRVGLYEPLSNERLTPYGDNTDSEGRFVVLGTITVEGR